MNIVEIINSEILEFINEDAEVNLRDVKALYNRFIAPIGTVNDYIQYTSNIFPNSKIKKIVYRNGLLQLSLGYGGIWFGEKESDVKKFRRTIRNEHKDVIHYCLINIRNPKYYSSFWHNYIWDVDQNPDTYNPRDAIMNSLIAEGYDGMIIDKSLWNDTTKKNSVTSEQYVVFDRKNIYSLGIKDDIAAFQKYLKTNNH